MRSNQKTCVLIADDQPEVLDLLAEQLRERGKEVIPFSSGTRLLQHLP